MKKSQKFTKALDSSNNLLAVVSINGEFKIIESVTFDFDYSMTDFYEEVKESELQAVLAELYERKLSWLADELKTVEREYGVKVMKEIQRINEIVNKEFNEMVNQDHLSHQIAHNTINDLLKNPLISKICFLKSGRIKVKFVFIHNKVKFDTIQDLLETIESLKDVNIHEP